MNQHHRPNPDKERQWKLHEEKQKAKQNDKLKRLDFARPVSATEPWKAPAGVATVGGGSGDKRRPLSARLDGEISLLSPAALARWRSPAEGQGDGIDESRTDGGIDEDEDATVEAEALGTEEVADDIEDVLIADNESFVTRSSR